MCWHPLARKLYQRKKMSDNENLNEAADSGLLQPRLVVPLLAWPDRCGFWIVEHHWGMELVESFLHGDDEEDESPYAIRGHHGGDTGNAGPFMPRDLEADIAAKTPRFLFVSDGNPFILPNAQGQTTAPQDSNS
jgi:hypothetical protein